MTQKRDLSNGISHFLKALLVLIFPLSFSGDSIVEILTFRSSGFLFTPVYSYPAIMTEITWILYSGSIILRNFVIGMLIILPGIFFSLKLSKAPLEKNYWKRGVGTAAGIYFLSIAMMIMVSLMLYDPYSYTYDFGYYQLFDNLRYFPTLVIGVFVILPMIQRQAVIIGTPKFLHHHSVSELESNPKFSLSRERILSAILWIFLCFGPYAVGGSTFYWYGIPFTSLSMTYYLDYYSAVRTFASTYNLTSHFVDFSSFPLVALVCIFQFMFVREIYRYLRKQVKKQRLVSMAILSIFGPLIMMNVISMTIGINMYYITLLPLPLLQCIGYIMIRYHKPKAQLMERIWEDVPHRMWWEKPVERPIPIMTTPERPIRHSDEELITIPLPYLVLSKLRSLNHREK